MIWLRLHRALYSSVIGCITLLTLLPVAARAFPATVVKVADGDTFTVYADGRKTRIRVFGIDAPEHDQPGGAQATADMIRLVLGKQVEIDPPPRHRQFPKSYDRIVAVATIGGADVGLTMLTLGDAWAYDQFDPPLTYDEAQAQAQQVKAGLWSEDRSIPPWFWRHGKASHRRH